jgi:hypothetical protein
LGVRLTGDFYTAYLRRHLALLPCFAIWILEASQERLVRPTSVAPSHIARRIHRLLASVSFVTYL